MKNEVITCCNIGVRVFKCVFAKKRWVENALHVLERYVN